MERKCIVDIFDQLNLALSNFGEDRYSSDVIERAISANGWFTGEGIIYALNAIRDKMLRRVSVDQWLSGYPSIEGEPKNVAVIMAGNIPLVGMFDMLCVLAAGHRCYIKPSSKDSVLIEYMYDKLKEIDKDIPLLYYGSMPVDAVIATGSDNTVRYLRSVYKDLPALFRSSRSSVAVLSGKEDDCLDALSTDIFTYCGLGCRNISHLLLPHGYHVDLLVHKMHSNYSTHPKYLNNYLQHRAMLQIGGKSFVDGGFFVMREDEDFPLAISEITYSFYASTEDIGEWLDRHEGELQCVVSDFYIHPRITALGTAQQPSLTDYPDGVDVIKWLTEL